MRVYKCDNCQAIFLKCQNICGRCGSENSMSIHDLSGEGEIVTFAIIHKGVEHLDAPYTLAVIQLSEGYQVMARIENNTKTSVGQRVRYLRNDEYGIIFGL